MNSATEHVRRTTGDAATTITTTSAPLQSLVFAERTVADVERSGDITVTGDRDTAEHLLRSPQHGGRNTSEVKHDRAVEQFEGGG